MLALTGMLLLPFLLAAAMPLQTTPPATKPAVPKPAAGVRPTTSRPAVRPPAKKTVPVTEEQKTIYALGLSLANSVKSFHLSPAELDLVKAALSDAAAGKPAIPLTEWQSKIRPLQESRFLAKAVAEPGAVKTDSGLIFHETTPGTGASPKSTDTVKVHYRGTLLDGTEFDSSYSRNEPAQFPLNRVIACWTEGVQKMKVGGKATLVCPPEIAYGSRGQGPIPANSILVFDIELLDIPGAGQ